MHLIIGGAYQGKKEYAKRNYHIEESQIWQGGYPVPAGEWRCINGLHNIVKYLVENEASVWTNEEILSYIRRFIDKIPDVIIICDEVGSGIVPVDRGEREYRECVGRILCELAKEADTVERVHCGIGQVIKSSVYISLIRHGSTAGNLEGKYVGVTDESLCEIGKEELKRGREKGLYPAHGSGCADGHRRIPLVELVITSPMKRCVETTQILYPGITPVIIGGFRETDFGLFEGKNYEELMVDEKLGLFYQAWIDADGKLPFPEGESLEQTRKRCSAAFEKLVPALADHAHTVMVLHGGTIMSILGTYAVPKRDYYAYQCENGTGYLCRLELTGDKQLYRLQCVGLIGRGDLMSKGW